MIPPSPFLIDERVFPALGILKVAAVLEAAGHRIDTLDLSGKAPGLGNFAVLRESPDFVGVTATTPQMPALVSEILPALRGRFPKARFILGGPHCTLSLAAAKYEKKIGTRGRGHRASEKLARLFDCLVAGDGEKAIFLALAPDAPKVIDADDRASEMWMSREQYEESPWPARHQIELKSYRYKIDGHRATSLIGQLGCPFHCGFCGGRHSPSLRVTRTRSVANIVAEVRHLHEAYGYTGFMFYDDELNVSPNVVALMDALCDLQDELGKEFAFRGFVKAELFHVEQSEAMARAGFKWMLCGFEAADDRILTNIRKRATLEDNTRAVELAHAAGMKVKALMSVGHPGERAESIAAIGDWLVAVGADDFDCTVITPYPGTPYHDEAVQNDGKVWTYTQPDTGDRLHTIEADFAERADYYKGKPGEYRAMVYTDHLTGDEICAMRDGLEETVRSKLAIPYPALPTFEHSMGQK